MISFALPLIAGNGARLDLSPPASAVKWRIARNTSGTFTNETSPDVIYEGKERLFLDYAGLVNGTVYHYKVFYFDGTDWDTSYPVRQITPGLFFADESVDPQTLIRSRLDSGLNGMIQSGMLKHPKNTISVLVSNPQIDKVQFPLVTVLLRSDRPEQYFIGGIINGDLDDFNTGHLSGDSIMITGWSNIGGDERIALRKAIKALLIANYDVFSHAGIMNLQADASDSEDFETYECAMYMTNFSLSFNALSQINPGIDYPILPINVNVEPFYD